VQRIPFAGADITDRARALGCRAIETYVLLLAGYGLLSGRATGVMLRRRWIGFRLNAVSVASRSHGDVRAGHPPIRRGLCILQLR
jgi:hypothetical protein